MGNHPPGAPAALALLLGVAGCIAGPSRVIYQVIAPTDQNDVFVVREDGSTDAALATTPDDEVACGVTTDHRIVFTRNTAAGGDIYVVNEDGGGLRPLRATAADEICFGVTSHDMVVFVTAVSPLDHDLFSISASSAATATPIVLSSTPNDDLPVAIGWDGRVLFAKQEPIPPIDGHRYSFYSIADDGTQLAPVVGVLEEPKFVAVSPGNRMVWTRPGPPPNGGLFSTPMGAPGSTAALNDFRHYLNPKGDFFCGFTPSGRVLLTSRSMYPVDGQDSGFGEVYAVNDDGTSLVLVNPGPPDYNELCLAGTDAWIVVGRYPFDVDVNPAEAMSVRSLWSYPASGAGHPVQLAAEAVTFEGMTPNGRVLFSRRDPATGVVTIQSIGPDGTGLATLASMPSTWVAGFTRTDHVLLESEEGAQGLQEDLYAVPSRGQAPATALATHPGFNVPSIVYDLDANGRATRCRVCEPGTDRGGLPVPSYPPFP